MIIPEEIRELLEIKLGKIDSSRSVFGGSINQAAMVQTSSGCFFLKWNSSKKYPNMFECEKRGLTMLSKHLSVPDNIETFEGSNYAGLFSSFIETTRGDTETWAAAGRMLALLHMDQQDSFGLDHSNYMGSLCQVNGGHNSFSEFFLEERLLPLAKMAADRNLISADEVNSIHYLSKPLNDIYGHEQPCLVHGDLWGGNLIFDSHAPYFIDPAVSTSSRFCDLAMTMMFGTFPDAFYASYREYYPYDSSQREGWDLLNLYPLLVHVVLFGSSYMGETLSVIRKYTK